MRPDGPQQRAGQGAGADAGLHHGGAREDVGERDDLGGVLGVDHGRTAGHRHHELAEQRPEDEVLPAGRRRDRETLLAPDQVVVLEVALVREEPLAGHQLEVVLAALLVGQPDPLAGPERSPVDAGPRLRATSGSSASGMTATLEPGVRGGRVGGERFAPGWRRRRGRARSEPRAPPSRTAAGGSRSSRAASRTCRSKRARTTPRSPRPASTGWTCRSCSRASARRCDPAGCSPPGGRSLGDPGRLDTPVPPDAGGRDWRPEGAT